MPGGGCAQCARWPGACGSAGHGTSPADATGGAGSLLSFDWWRFEPSVVEGTGGAGGAPSTGGTGNEGGGVALGGGDATGGSVEAGGAVAGTTGGAVDTGGVAVNGRGQRAVCGGRRQYRIRLREKYRGCQDKEQKEFFHRSGIMREGPV